MTASATPRKPITLSLHPNTRGFGWTAFQAPTVLYDFGLFFVDQDKNTRCLDELERLFARLLPDAFVLEDYGPAASRRSERTRRLATGMAALSINRGIDVAVYTRDQVRACFASVGAKTREEIAHAIAQHHDALRALLPRRRKAWMAPDRRMAIFAAAALALTHYNLGGNARFELLAA